MKSMQKWIAVLAVTILLCAAVTAAAAINAQNEADYGATIQEMEHYLSFPGEDACILDSIIEQFELNKNFE